jgi:hypothetical protein
MENESINLAFILIDDVNLRIILNDPDVNRQLKDLIVKLSTDKLYISKLSNDVEKSDYNVLYKKTYKQDKKDLLTYFKILVDTFKIRKKEHKRFEKYYDYLNSVF